MKIIAIEYLMSSEHIMSKIDLINKAFDKGIDDENHNVVNDAVNEILSDLNQQN